MSCNLALSFSICPSEFAVSSWGCLLSQPPPCFPVRVLTALLSHCRWVLQRLACSVPSSGELRTSWLWQRRSQVTPALFCLVLGVLCGSSRPPILEPGDAQGQVPAVGSRALRGLCASGRGRKRSTTKPAPSALVLRALSSHQLAAAPMSAQWVGGGSASGAQTCWCLQSC